MLPTRVFEGGLMRNLKITVEYDGTRYRGWQVQKNARTVGETFAGAAAAVLGEAPQIFAAGRTDAGVHAMGQVVSFRTRSTLSPREILERLNDRLPTDINVLEVDSVPLSFHARHTAISRTYRYQVSTRRTAFGKRFVWWVRSRLDAGILEEGAALVLGAGDFRSFSEGGGGEDGEEGRAGATRVRVMEAAWVPEDSLTVFRIRADRFLWKMVRRLVGTMVAAATGRIERDAMTRWLATPSRDSAALTAPPSGLFLESVEYPPIAPPGDPDIVTAARKRPGAASGTRRSS